jgi:hypothetical protein
MLSKLYCVFLNIFGPDWLWYLAGKSPTTTTVLIFIRNQKLISIPGYFTTTMASNNSSKKGKSCSFFSQHSKRNTSSIFEEFRCHLPNPLSSK